MDRRGPSFVRACALAVVVLALPIAARAAEVAPPGWEQRIAEGDRALAAGDAAVAVASFGEAQALVAEGEANRDARVVVALRSGRAARQLRETTGDDASVRAAIDQIELVEWEWSSIDGGEDELAALRTELAACKQALVPAPRMGSTYVASSYRRRSLSPAYRDDERWQRGSQMLGGGIALMAIGAAVFCGGVVAALTNAFNGEADGLGGGLMLGGGLVTAGGVPLIAFGIRNRVLARRKYSRVSISLAR